MDFVNTNIDDYSNEEILALMKVDIEDSYNENFVKQKVNQVIQALTASESLSKNRLEELTNFFRNCFLRISVSRKFPLTDETKQELGLNAILPPVPSNPDNPRVVAKLPYEDSVPQPIPAELTINTHKNKYALGNVNPLDIETVKHLLIINSKFRTNNNSALQSQSQSDRIRSMTLNQPNYIVCRKIRAIKECEVTKTGNIGTVSDFTIELTSPYKDVVAIKAAALTFDNYYYSVSEYLQSNQVIITAFDYDPSASDPATTIANVVEEVITIDDGTYNICEMVAELQRLFNASSSASINAILATESLTRNKIILSVNPSPSVPPPAGRAYGFNLSFGIESCPTRELYMGFGWMLGFREVEYNFFTDYNTTASASLAVGYNPEACINLIGTPSFFLEVDDFNKNHPKVIDYNCTSNTSINLTNLLCKIPNVSPFAAQVYEDSSDRIFKKRKYFGPVRISKLRIRFLDDNGIPIDLNGGNFTLSLEIETLNKSTKSMIV